MVLIFGSLCSCSPEAKLRRANKQLYNLLKKNPELSRHDTVFQTVDVLIPSKEVDTVFAAILTTDTIVIKKDNVIVKYFNDGKTVYLKGVCDTIRVSVRVPIAVTTIQPAKEVYVTKWYHKMSMWWMGISVVLAGGWVFVRVK